MKSALSIGLKGEAETVVKEHNTAFACGSGSVPVFSTPALVGLMEQAALSSVESALEPGETTVGTRIEVSHLAATPLGMRVKAISRLVEVDGKRLVFEVEAWDDGGRVGEGRHERVIVSRASFLKRAADKGAAGS